MDGSVKKSFNAKRISSKCAVNNCILSCSRADVDRADVVLYHAMDLVPKYRTNNPTQNYIFWVRESPIHVDQRVVNKRDFWNSTMTYRRDSDILFGYIYIAPRQSISRNDHVPLNKKKLIAWFV